FKTEIEPKTSVKVPLSGDTMQPVEVTIDGVARSTTMGPSVLLGWLDTAYALNSLRASYTAAATLIEQGQHIETARRMLDWVVLCGTAVEDAGTQIQGFAQLRRESMALKAAIDVSSDSARCLIPNGLSR
ncbi:MAG: hypothetical protein AAFV29_20575, partial [Myxococcota bacterium]